MNHTLTVIVNEERHCLEVASGTNLREALLDAGFSPYARLTQLMNCGGRGLCATCGVLIDDDPDPIHWHDRLAAQYGYPRLSCQITVERDLVVTLVTDKHIWGGRHSAE